MNYMYSNDSLPFHRFDSDLRILQNCALLIKGYCLKKFQGHTIGSSVCLVGMTKLVNEIFSAKLL